MKVIITAVSADSKRADETDSADTSRLTDPADTDRTDAADSDGTKTGRLRLRKTDTMTQTRGTDAELGALTGTTENTQ